MPGSVGVCVQLAGEQTIEGGKAARRRSPTSATARVPSAAAAAANSKPLQKPPPFSIATLLCAHRKSSKAIRSHDVCLNTRVVLRAESQREIARKRAKRRLGRRAWTAPGVRRVDRCMRCEVLVLFWLMRAPCGGGAARVQTNSRIASIPHTLSPLRTHAHTPNQPTAAMA